MKNVVFYIKKNKACPYTACCLWNRNAESERFQVESEKLIQDQFGQFNEIISLISIYLFIYMLVYRGSACVTVNVWRSEDSQCASACFSCMASENWTKVNNNAWW